MKTININKNRSLLIQLILLISFGLLFVPQAAEATDSLCARVKIEIKQELTLERQAFDAHMRITNGLTEIPLNEVNIEVKAIRPGS